MKDLIVSAAVLMAFLGPLLGAVRVIALLIAMRRHSSPPLRLIAWNQVAWGLALSLPAFYGARGLSSGVWGRVDDLPGLLLVLGVSAWGFASTSEWVATYALTSRAWWWISNLLSCLLGLLVGLAATELQV